MSTRPEVQFVRVLGRTEVVRTDGTSIAIPSASQRRLLSALALHAPGTVRSGFLCQLLDVSPGALRTSVARLRRLVGEAALETTAGGYRLDLPVDATALCAEIDQARDDPDRLARALGRWTGVALEEFRDEGWAFGEAQRLDEIRAGAVEDLAELRIEHGNPARAVQELQRHIAGNPFRDRPRTLLLRALAASGRRTEAMRAYQDYRRQLGEDVGTEPGEAVRAVERRIAAGWDGVDDDWSAEDLTDEAPPPIDVDDALRGASTAVGRRRAIERLVEAVARTGTEGTGTIVVAGEVGIGKTTLVAELARTLANTRGWPVRYGRCDELAAGPFQPFPSLVGRLVDELPDLDLLAHAAAHGGDVLRLVPTHADRIGAPPTATADERTARHLLFEAVVDLVARSADGGPTVLVIDDVQWAQPAALHLLRYLARALGPAPVLLVLVIRDTGDPVWPEVRDALADLARGRFQRIDLGGLDRAEITELVHERVPSTVGHDVGAVAGALVHETAGNPLFADQLLAHWADDGRLVVTDGNVELHPPATEDVPATLRDLVWHRVGLLGEAAGPTLTAAAVLGLEFNERALGAMADVDADVLPALLDRAVAAGVLADHPTSAGAVRFSHALVARALEADLTPRARARLHAQAFEATRSAAGPPSDDLAPRLAAHARAGGMDVEAHEWAIAAGDRALADLAPHEAATWFETALADVAALARPDAARADLLVRLGEARSSAGDAPGALDAFCEAAELAARRDEVDVLVGAALAVDRGTVPMGQSAIERLEIVELAYERREHLDTATRAQLAGLVA